MKNKKSYDWEEIKNFLTEKLKGTKSIMTFGTIGSCNVDNDIDVIITKKPKSKSSDFYREIHGLFDKLNKYLLEKYSKKLIRFSKMEEKLIIKHLGGGTNKDLLFHTLVYLSYPQMEKDWDAALLECDNLKNILKKYAPLKGHINDLFSTEFQKSNYYDSLFTFLYLGDRINSHYPEKLLIESMNQLFNYLFRKRLGLRTPLAKNEKQIRENFYSLCDILDELNSKKN